MSIGGVVIQFKADADKARRDVDKLAGSIDKVGDEAKSSGRKFSAMAKVGIGAAVAGIGLGVTALVRFGKAAADDFREAQALVDVLKNVPGVTQAMIDANADWIGSMELATNIADKDLRESIAKLAVATQDLGEAQELSALAADIAAARQMSLADATSLLEKAVGGNTMMLKRNMPWLDANKDGTITLQEAVDGLGDAYGGAAEKAANRDPWKKLEVIWGNIEEALGQAFIPTLETLGDWFKDKKNIAKIQEWIDKIGEWSRQVGEDFKDKIVALIDYLQSGEGQQAMSDFAGGLQAIADAVGVLADAIGVLKKAFQGLEDIFAWFFRQIDKVARFFDETVPKLGRFLGLRSEENLTPTERKKYFEGGTGSPLPKARTSGGGNFTVNATVINGKQEKSVDSAAMAIRLARSLGATGAVL